MKKFEVKKEDEAKMNDFLQMFYEQGFVITDIIYSDVEDKENHVMRVIKRGGKAENLTLKELAKEDES